MAEANKEASVSQPSHNDNPSSRPAIPYLKGTVLDEFRVIGPLYTREDAQINIAAQTDLLVSIYNQLVQLTAVDPPINQDDFVRMCRTLILKRVQDTLESSRGIRADHFIRISRSTIVPAPLGDLLYAIGSYSSKATGRMIDMTPPAREAVVPNWWALDNDIFANYSLFCARMSNKYRFYEFPKPQDFLGRSICLTTIADANGLREIRALTNEVTTSDVLIRTVNNDLFTANDWLVYNNCRLVITQARHITSVRMNYIRSYVIDSAV